MIPKRDNPASDRLTVVSADGTRLAYEVLGDGPALVVVTGALSALDFPHVRQFAQTFATRFRVYVYDRRGRGGSTDTPPYSVDKEIDDLAAVCREATQPIVLGVSSGAALALAAAARGVPMRCLVAYEPPYMVGEHRTAAHTALEADVAALIAKGDRDGALRRHLRTVGLPAWALLVMRILPAWRRMRAVAHTLPYDAAVMDGWDPPAALAGIRVPVLVCGGGNSPPSLRAAVRAAADAVPGASWVELPKQTHAVDAGVLLRVVEQFTQGK